MEGDFRFHLEEGVRSRLHFFNPTKWTKLPSGEVQASRQSIVLGQNAFSIYILTKSKYRLQ